MRYSALLFSAAVVSLLSHADWTVLRAFEHPRGFVVFEVTSKEYFNRMRDAERQGRAHKGVVVLTSGNHWMFGKKTDHEFTQLTPAPQMHFLGKGNEEQISFPFVSSSNNGHIEAGWIEGVLIQEDPFSEITGSVEIKVGEVSSGPLTYSSILTEELNKKLKDNEISIAAPVHTTFKTIHHLLIDNSGTSYAIDSEVPAEYDWNQDRMSRLEQRVKTAEVLRIPPNGSPELVAIKKYSEPMEEISERSLSGSINFHKYEAPQLVIEFENGDRLVMPPIRSEDKRHAVLYSEGTETDLQYTPRHLDDLKKVGLENRYRIVLLNPCVAILAGQK